MSPARRIYLGAIAALAVTVTLLPAGQAAASSPAPTASPPDTSTTVGTVEVPLAVPGVEAGAAGSAAPNRTDGKGAEPRPEMWAPPHTDKVPPGGIVGRIPSTDELREQTRRNATVRQAAAQVAAAAATMFSASSGTRQETSAPAEHPVPGVGGYIPPGNSPGVGMSRHVLPYCGGTGVDGRRIQVLYLREQAQPSRLAALRSEFLDELAMVDDIYAASSDQTNGGRRIRWVTDKNCVPVIKEVVVPNGSIDGDVFKTRAQLRDRGYDGDNRKHLVFTEGEGVWGGCGAGTYFVDTSPGQENWNNYGGSIARVDAGCWFSNGSIAAHEVTHALGGVFDTAPNASGNGHCNDGNDLMCYADGGPTSKMRIVDACKADRFSYLLDCGKNDYFSTAPAAGSWLAKNWNTANSAFLAKVQPLSKAGTAKVTASAATAWTGAPITFTATPTNTAAKVASWNITPSSCTAAPTGNKVAVTCPAAAVSAGKVTAKATLVIPSVTRVDAPAVSVPLQKAAAPSATVTTKAGDWEATVGSTVAVSASGGAAPYKYQWSGPAGCTFANAKAASTTVTCDSSTLDTAVTATVTVTASDGQQTVAQVTRTVRGTVQFSGPVRATTGADSTMKASLVAKTNPVSWRWTSARGWLKSGDKTATVTVAVPAGATGTDTLTLTVVDDADQTWTRTFTYTATAPFTSKVTRSSSAVYAGEKVQLTSTTSFPAKRSWTVAGSTCKLSSTTTAKVSLSCPRAAKSHTATVTLNATETNVAAPRSTRTTVKVPVRPLQATSWTGTAVSGKSTMRMQATLRGPGSTKVSGVKARLLFKPSGTSRWLVTGTVTTGRNGVAARTVNTTRAGHWRWQFQGSGRWKASINAPKFVKAPTRLTIGRVGLRIHGRAYIATKTLGNASVRLEYRPHGTKTWRLYKTVKSARAGGVALRVNRKATYYRWRVIGTTTRAGSVSPQMFVPRNAR